MNTTTLVNKVSKGEVLFLAMKGTTNILCALTGKGLVEFHVMNNLCVVFKPFESKVSKIVFLTRFLDANMASITSSEVTALESVIKSFIENTIV